MPLRSVQSVLRKILPEAAFVALYRKACNAYDVYIHIADWIYYRASSTNPDIRRDKRWLEQAARYSMTSREGLTYTLNTTRDAIRDKVPGAFVECGVARGGCAALMALAAKEENSGRQTWLFDSFEGLPQQSEQDGKQKPIRHKDRRANDLAEGYCYGSLEDVEGLFDRLDLTGNAHMVKGWFENTLPVHRSVVGSIAVLRLDGDWYESTKCCLDNLYDNVSPRGFVIIDDYSLPGCKLAVDQFVAHNHLDIAMYFDRNGRAYWRK